MNVSLQTIFSDSFDRDLTPYTQERGTFSIASSVLSVATAEASDLRSALLWDGASLSDGSVSLTLGSKPNNTTGSLLLFRMTQSGASLAGYAVQPYNFLITKYTRLYSLSSGTLTLIGALDTTSPWTTNDVLRVDFSGPTITSYRNGAQTGSLTDPTFISGRVGLGTSGGTAIHKWNDILVQSPVSFSPASIARTTYLMGRRL